MKQLLMETLPPYVLRVAKRMRDHHRQGWLHPVDVALPADVPVPAPSPSPASVVRNIIALEPPEWEAVPVSDEVWTNHAGWAHDSIADMQRERWPGFLASLEAKRPFGWRDSKPGETIDVSTHNTLMTFGYVLGVAAAARQRISLLDWGGGLGQYGRYAALLRPDLKIDYTVKDLPALCKAGRELNPDAEFIEDDERALARRYDFIFASSSLQYTRNLYPLLARICDATADTLLITRTPFVSNNDDFVVVQRPYRYGYQTEYPAWFINRNRFIDFIAGRGLRLEREFMLGERPYVPNAPEQCVYCGFLFTRDA